MDGESRNSFYDLGPLEPYIERGCTLLTPNFRLARRIRSEWDRRCVARGATDRERAHAAALAVWAENEVDRSPPRTR